MHSHSWWHTSLAHPYSAAKIGKGISSPPSTWLHCNFYRKGNCHLRGIEKETLGVCRRAVM
ncbi:hypothetical protein I79_008057 [Cricetulus griseus]|uniref:Uncharacterized protein n=1 Tax=Cricetulus griseus TaxID=10029 RepID=G3HC15_CRIGR|nr:hypothetical protein I79_008057 [Cricetulus griseus]